jgi:hypothetical protein
MHPLIAACRHAPPAQPERLCRKLWTQLALELGEAYAPDQLS